MKLIFKECWNQCPIHQKHPHRLLQQVEKARVKIRPKALRRHPVIQRVSQKRAQKNHLQVQHRLQHHRYC